MSDTIRHDILCHCFRIITAFKLNLIFVAMSVESIRRRIMLKREPKAGNLGQGTILSKSFIVCMYGIDTRTLTIYVKELSFCHKL